MLTPPAVLQLSPPTTSLYWVPKKYNINNDLSLQCDSYMLDVHPVTQLYGVKAPATTQSAEKQTLYRLLMYMTGYTQVTVITLCIPVTGAAFGVFAGDT